MRGEALEPGQREHDSRKERQRALVHREKTRERAREGVMTREERLLGEMRATTLARERRMEVEREREHEQVQEIVRMRAREREVGGGERKRESKRDRESERDKERAGECARARE